MTGQIQYGPTFSKRGYNKGWYLSLTCFMIQPINKSSKVLPTLNQLLQRHHFHKDDNALSYFKLLVLLYADDTILFSDNSEDMQNALNVFEEYCKMETER